MMIRHAKESSAPTGRGAETKWVRPALIALLTVFAALNGGAVWGQSGSNASNYNHGAQLQVNQRTGDITMSTDLVRLPGIVAELGLRLAISYRSEDARSAIQNNTRHFGMPYGWSLGLSFIYNEGSTVKLNVDGTSAYQLDENWRTSFVPTGSEVPLSAKTGLREYNRADAHLRTDQGSVTVNGLPSAYIFTNLQGQSKFFSPGGLMIREEDRFGNFIDYHYINANTGQNASTSTTAANAELSEMIDTWGNTVTVGRCLDPQTCIADEWRITLPDGRTMGWVAPDSFTITQLIDTEGMVTHLEWENSTCGDQSYANRRLANMTTSVGGMTSLSYTCLDVCLEPSGTQCAQTTSWSVVSEQVQCPNNTSGTACPTGSAGDHMTTRYSYGTPDDNRNYTGYPRYSPFRPSVAGSDALMSAPDAGSFQYSTVVSKHRVAGAAIHQVETDYNFLHLEQEQRIFVSDGVAALKLSKETSHCYPISDSEPEDGCPLTSANYQSLPSNYQSAIVTGTCQYNLDGSANARKSIVTMNHDAFGNMIRKRIYHATADTGIISTCDRAKRLDSTGMRLIVEDHMQHDTPTSLGTDDYVELGSGSGRFGLMLAQQSFVYLDEDDTGVGAHGELGATTEPVLVKLLCNALTTGGSGGNFGEAVGANIKTSTTGLMARSASPPTTLGIVSACPQPGGDGGAGGGGSSWISLPAPPKSTEFAYDDTGRSLSQVTRWAAGFESPGGISSTNQSFAYSLGAATEDEEDCPGDESVLQIVSTDTEGHSRTNRLCTLNGFHLSAADANGNTTYMEHSANGMTTKTTHADGSFVETEHYYACPTAQDGRTATCPEGSTALKNCPHDSASQKRNCIVKTMSSADGQSSFVDGVRHVMIRDGLGRVVAELDNLGGSSGNGFTAMQTTKTKTFDDRGVLTKSATIMGASEPLVYESTFTLDAKLRPAMVCGPRLNAHEFIHDDVNQKTMTVFNGSDREGYTMNDSHKLTGIANCDLVSGQSQSGDGDCPTVAADVSSADCEGDAYVTYTLHDGAGQEHSLTASTGTDVDQGASVTGINGVATYSADMLKYGYNLDSDNQVADALSASSSFKRDLQGRVLEHVVTVEKTDNAQPTPSTTTSVFASDQYEYNGIDQKILERNKLSDLDGAPTLAESYNYDPVGNLESMTTYAGVTFENYYDERNRLVRHCFPTDNGSEGEKMELDPITGATVKVTRFTSTDGCSADDSNDTDVVSETYTYTRFGAIESLTYSDGTTLEWGYDPYHRIVCMADALATASGNGCPDSPIDVGFAPAASELLVSYEYWDDDDSHRRGMLKRKCRGVPDGAGGSVKKCVESDYYRSIDSGGGCSSSLDDIVGAYGGLIKTQTYCSGGSCEDMDATEVYKTTYLYDEHRRPCSVETANGSGAIILSSAYEYDQFDNVVHEEHSSDLEPSQDSNYSIDYVYDGMLRLVEETRNNADGDLIKNTTFEYDAASNLIRKTEEEPDELGTDPTATPTGSATATPETPDPTESPAGTATPSAPATATESANTPSRTATATTPSDDDSCRIDPQPTRAPSWFLLSLAAAVFALRKRRNRYREG